MMPRFFADMPAPHAGDYTATVLTTSPFRPDRIVWQRRISGRLRAYLAVRWAAFCTHCRTPQDGRWELLGILWRLHPSPADPALVPSQNSADPR